MTLRKPMSPGLSLSSLVILLGMGVIGNDYKTVTQPASEAVREPTSIHYRSSPPNRPNDLYVVPRYLFPDRIVRCDQACSDVTTPVDLSNYARVDRQGD